MTSNKKKEKIPERLQLALCTDCNTIAGIVKKDYDTIHCTGLTEHLKSEECTEMTLQIISIPKDIALDLVEEVRYWAEDEAEPEEIEEEEATAHEELEAKSLS